MLTISANVITRGREGWLVIHLSKYIYSNNRSSSTENISLKMYASAYISTLASEIERAETIVYGYSTTKEFQSILKLKMTLSRKLITIHFVDAYVTYFLENKEKMVLEFIFYLLLLLLLVLL